MTDTTANDLHFEASPEAHHGHSEHRLAAERRHHLADDPEAGEDHDIDFRVAEEPEQVLVEHGVAASAGIEEGRVEIAVGEQHRDRAGEDR